MSVSIKKLEETIDRLRGYNGANPYLLMIKRDVIVKGKNDVLTDFCIDYIKKNVDFVPKVINKTVKIADWYGEKKKEDWGTDFVPQKLKIISFLGETDSVYHCYVQYRQSVDPVQAFIPKKAIIGNFLVEDYNNISVDFDRYDRLSTSKDPNRRLKEHQKVAVKFLLGRKKCVLADDMGLGKTTSATVAAIEGNFDSILIICPASVKENWKNELLWYVPERDITIVEGFQGKNKSELEAFLGYGIGKSGKKVEELKNEAKERGKWSENRFVIVNYDILDEFYEIPATRSSENIKKAYENSPILQFIANKKSLIIVDEAHRLSNMSSKQYKIIKDLINRGKPDSLYLMTGTPITNDPQNYYNLLNLIGDPITDDWKYYMERYCGAVEFPKNAEEKAKRNEITQNFVRSKGKFSWYDLTDDEKKALNEIVKRNVKMITVAKGAENLDELKERTAHIYLRRVKEDLTDLEVKKNVHEVFYDFDVVQIMEYEKLWEDYENAQLEADPNKEINKELLEGAVYRKYCSNQMVPNTEKLVDSFIEKGEKVVIACCYDEELYTLKDYYGDKCVVFNGKMNAKEKLESERLFKEDPNVMVFIGNIQSAGVGINLVSSHIVVFNNFSWAFSDNSQFEDRVFRIGQTKNCDIYYQYFRNTQYERMWEVVLKKEMILKKVIVDEKHK